MTGHDIRKSAIILTLWAAAFLPLFPGLFREWTGNPDNSHALLVPFITLYFIRDRRDRLRSATVEGSSAGMALFGASLLIYLASYAGGSAFPARVAMITALAGLAWGCLGAAILRILALPLAILLFMIPVPHSLISVVSMPLQLAATRVAEILIGFCSIPVYREGNMLYFTRTQLEVAEACSGIRSITALAMTGLVLACMARGTRSARVILVLMSLPIAVAVNIVRVTGTGILAHFYGEQVARGFLHEFSGLAIFALGFMMLWFMYALIGRRRVCDAA